MDECLNILQDTSFVVENSTDGRIIGTSDLFIDPYGDIIASFMTRKRTYMYQIGINGVKKDRRQVTEIPADSSTVQVRHSDVYNAHPLSYHFLTTKKVQNGQFRMDAYFVDSLFNVIGEHRYYKFDNQKYFMDGMQEHLVSNDDSTYFFVSKAEGLENYQHHDYTAWPNTTEAITFLLSYCLTKASLT